MFTQVALPFRLVRRSQEIGLVFVSHGVAGVLTNVGLEASRAGIALASGNAPTPFPINKMIAQNLVRTFVRLGPTFVKLGQILASRPDLVGDVAADTFKVLLDRVPPISFRRVRGILISEIGKKKIKELISDIDPKPLACGSLSQIHRASLKDGTPILLKIQKPGVADLVKIDLKLMEGFVLSVHMIYPKLNLLQVFDDFKASALREIDYLEEAKNIDRFRKNYRSFLSQPGVVFPSYYPELTTEKVIALEPLHGKKVADLKAGSKGAKKAAASTVISMMEQMFDHGFFHADPHAGNLFFLEETGRIGFVDLGMVGQLDDSDREKFLKLFLAVLKKDRSKLAATLYEMGTPAGDSDPKDFEADIDAFIDELKGAGIEGMRMDETLNRLLEICRTHSLQIPNRYLLMLRSCLLMEGVAKSLDPDLSLADLAAPIIAKSLLKTMSPLRFFKRK